MHNIQKLRVAPRCLTAFIAAATVVSMGACSGEASAPPVRKELMWGVSAVPLAISLAVGDTYTVRVDPLDYDKNVITEDVSFQYRSSDTTRVAVDPNGVVTARASTSGSGITVTVDVFAGVVRKSTQVIFGVTATPVDVDSMSLESTTGSFFVPIGDNGLFKARLFDSDGNEVFGVHTRTRTADDTSGAFSPSTTSVYARGPGSIKVIAGVLVNGKLVSDSVVYHAKWREYADLRIARSYDSTMFGWLAGRYTTNVFMSKNGHVEISNDLNVPVDVTFENPDGAKGSDAGGAGGNIAALQPGARVSRWFPALGDYFFTIKAGTESKRLSVSIKD